MTPIRQYQLLGEETPRESNKEYRQVNYIHIITLVALLAQKPKLMGLGPISAAKVNYDSDTNCYEGKHQESQTNSTYKLICML
jgi:hypothetical protein